VASRTFAGTYHPVVMPFAYDASTETVNSPTSTRTGVNPFTGF